MLRKARPRSRQSHREPARKTAERYGQTAAPARTQSEPYLADTSALARLRHPPVAEVLGPLIETGLVATCGVIEFELTWAARTSAELDELRPDRDAGYEWLATLDEDWRRALQVQAELWRSGQMRPVGLPDLLVAAVAEREHVTVLHYDAGYDLVAQITGQPVRCVVPRGTVP